MNNMIRAFAIVLCQGTWVFAAPSVVALSGTVTKSAGGPLGGVTVGLKLASNLSVATTSDGRFMLSSGAAGLLQRTRNDRLSPTFGIEGSTFLVAMQSGDIDGSVEVFSARGERGFSSRLSGRNSSVRSVQLEAFSHGLNVVLVRLDGLVTFRSVLRVDQRLFMEKGADILSMAAPSGLSRALANPVLDTLIFKKTGFKEKAIPITSYIDSNLSISMDSVPSGTCTPPKPGTNKSNPIFSDAYTADPGVMVDNCTFYIQAGHDQGTGGFDLREWFLLKSTDMVTWTRTTPMTLKTFAWTNANAWAGQMIKGRNGKYYWYVPINDIRYSADRMAIGVAVADSPEGPWKDALGKPLIRDSLEMSTWNITDIDQTPHTIDPTVFIDDDGQAYLQYGGFWTMVTVKLNPDMITIAGKLTKTTPPDYFESPYLIKRGNLYYEIYAHGSANPTTIDYATSNSPMGPWTHKGTILSTMPKVAGQDETTNHAAVAEFAGQWYIVYHISNGPNGGGTYKREVAIDKLTFNSDGSIKPVIPSAALTF